MDGVIRCGITLGPASSTDANFDGMAINSVAAQNGDDDVPVGLSAWRSTASVVMMEVAATAAYSLRASSMKRLI